MSKKNPHITARDPEHQTIGTPESFLIAVDRRFGEIGFDLAATKDNAVVKRYYSPEQDSLAQDWGSLGLRAGQSAFLNPPFAHIAPWAAKLYECRNLPRWTGMLVPYSGGSKWWEDYVRHKLMTFGIPRMRFVGQTHLFPKDLAFICAGFGCVGEAHWDWRLELTKAERKNLDS